MPHAVTPDDTQEELDNLLIQQALDPQNEFDFDRELEPGEKADDAIDYEDISDDDLAEEVDQQSTESAAPGKDGGTFVNDLDLLQGSDYTSGDAPGGGDEFADLFGEGALSPGDNLDAQGAYEANAAGTSFETNNDQSLDDLFEDDQFDSQDVAPTTEHDTEPSLGGNLFRPIDFSAKAPAAPSREQLLQQELFAMSIRHGLGGSADIVPAPPENQEELLASLWPKFERDTVPRFMDLLPPKKARYIGKTPLKTPKPLQMTKVNLELASDQEKSFKLPSFNVKKTLEDFQKEGLIEIAGPDATESTSEDELDIDSDYETESVGGLAWQDFQLLCEDWAVPEASPSPLPGGLGSPDVHIHDQDDFLRELDEWGLDMGEPAAKRQKLLDDGSAILNAPRFILPSLHDPESTTAKIARKVILDLNDPKLLIDEDRSALERSKNRLKRMDFTRQGRVAFSKSLTARYDISNDDAYDLLKENHQSKVRSTLGNVAISHSIPALRLQWPYYKTKLAKQEARSFHRPTAYFPKGEPITFSKPRIVKRKHLKGKDVPTIFNSTKDLSLGDNSNNLLLEYSEEHPNMMSNFGMGSRVINYYRKKNMEDTTRPKLDIGEPIVLLPQDKSPLTIFGHIDPGQLVPAIHNSMFKAPIFKQEPKPTDFLLIRNATGVDGANWYLRNIENLHVVGQQFPSTDIPGPHSRKVTTASKNRLKMISYRQIRRNKRHRIAVSEVTKHFVDTTDMQNRQKMKEFMVFSKEHKEWEMKPGEAIPDEETVRTMIKPEDVCLLEAMQVGQQHLLDAGFTKEDDDSENDEGKEGQSIEQQLAPWYTSRNFSNAASGKAMLKLHGDGDPTGRGEGFSFLKTSMKGGFRALGQSVEDTLKAKEMKELGGHSYNVAKQQKQYEDSIRQIWEKQKMSLSSTMEPSLSDGEQDDSDANNDVGIVYETAIVTKRRDDDTGSQFSKFSADSQAGKVLKITRDVEDKYGNTETVTELIRDPRVIRQYLKRRHAREDELLE
jgi:hypothetical protein